MPMMLQHDEIISTLYVQGKSINYISDIVHDLYKRTLKGFNKKDARRHVENYILRQKNIKGAAF